MAGSASRLLSGDAYAFENLTVTSAAAKSLTLLTWDVSNSSKVAARITVDKGQIRYRYDNTDATTTVGHLAGYGDTIWVEGTHNVKQFSVIATDGDASLMITYEKVYG